MELIVTASEYDLFVLHVTQLVVTWLKARLLTLFREREKDEAPAVSGFVFL